jgi:hypothetical protein
MTAKATVVGDDETQCLRGLQHAPREEPKKQFVLWKESDTVSCLEGIGIGAKFCSSEVVSQSVASLYFEVAIRVVRRLRQRCCGLLGLGGEMDFGPKVVWDYAVVLCIR